MFVRLGHFGHCPVLKEFAAEFIPPIRAGRLHVIGRGAAQEAFLDVIRIGRGAEHQLGHNVQAVVFLDMFQHREPITPGHFQVDQEEVGKGVTIARGVFSFSIQVVNRFLPVMGLGDKGVRIRFA